MTTIGLSNGILNKTPAQSDEAARNNVTTNATNNVKKTSSVSSSTNAAESKNSDNLTLSTRGQKLHAISNEFFAGGGFTNIDSRKLIERVHEYGLISDAEYKGLTGSALFKKESSTDETKTSSLVDYLQSMKDKVSKGDDESLGNKKQQFLDGIDKAKTILKDVETAKLTPKFKSDLTQSLASLKTVQSTDFYQSLSQKEKSDLDDSVLALEIIDKISPQRLTNAQVNRYLDFAS